MIPDWLQELINIRADVTTPAIAQASATLGHASRLIRIAEAAAAAMKGRAECNLAVHKYRPVGPHEIDALLAALHGDTT